MSRHYLCIFLVLFLKIVNSWCVCETRWVVLCDNIDDVLRIPLATLRVNQVHIGGNHDTPRDILTDHHLRKLANLVFNQVIIMNQLNGINLSGDTHYYPKSIVLHGNDIPLIPRPIFTVFGNKSLISLQNNEIEKIDQLFSQNDRPNTIKFVDLSRNKLQSIGNIFTNEQVEKLDLSHNRLSSILGSPLGLKILIMSNNSIESTDFISLPNSKPTLEVLDLSHNRLETVTTHFFGKFKALKIFNLKFNRLTTFTLSDFGDFGNYAILLAYNRLRNLDLKSQQRRVKIMVTLSGNPWNCRCMEKMGRRFRQSGSWVKRGECDDRLTSNALLPYCAINNHYNEVCPDQKNGGIDLEHYFYKLKFSVADDPTCDFSDLMDSGVGMSLVCLLYGYDFC